MNQYFELIIKIGIVLVVILFVINILLEFKKRKKREKSLNQKRERGSEEVSKLIEKYKQICDEVKSEIAEKKKKYIVKNTILMIIVIIAAISFIMIILSTKFYRKMLLYLTCFFAFFIVVTIFLFIMVHNREEYKKILKNKIINRVINYSNPNLKYYTNVFEYKEETGEKINVVMNIKEECVVAKFDEHRIDGIEIEDYINGSICDGVKVQMMDLDLYKMHKSHRGKQLPDYHFFVGSLVIIDKSVNNHIKIISNKINDLDSELSNDNCEFEKYFKTDSLVSSDLKNFLLDFRNKYKLEFDIVLKDKIYVRFYTKNMFEPKLFGNPIDETSIYQYYAITKFAEEIVNVFDN